MEDTIKGNSNSQDTADIQISHSSTKGTHHNSPTDSNPRSTGTISSTVSNLDILLKDTHQLQAATANLPTVNPGMTLREVIPTLNSMATVLNPSNHTVRQRTIRTTLTPHREVM